MAEMICDRIKVIDSDTHVSEPETLWTDRISTKKWGDLVPHVIFDDEINEDRWVMGGKKFMPTAGAAMAGWKSPPPNHPPTLQEADHGSWEIRERLERMDEYGMYAQVVYPNVGGFGSGNFLTMTDDELRLDCVRAYNDFLIDWTSVDKDRFIPIMAMPFWDVQACVEEMARAHDRGHKGVLMTNQPHTFGFPRITEQHWDPLWNQAQDMGLSINFHIGSGDLTELRNVTVDNGRQAAYAKSTVKLFLDNSNAILDVILSGMCHRFPELKIVSVESGVGWIPYLLEAMDWQWLNSGCRGRAPRDGPAPVRVLPPPVLRLLLVRRSFGAQGDRGVRLRELPVRDRLPAPDVNVAGPEQRRPQPQGARRASPQRPPRGRPTQRPPAQRRQGLQLRGLGVAPHA